MERARVAGEHDGRRPPEDHGALVLDLLVDARLDLRLHPTPDRLGARDGHAEPAGDRREAGEEPRARVLLALVLAEPLGSGTERGRVVGQDQPVRERQGEPLGEQRRDPAASGAVRRRDRHDADVAGAGHR